MTRPTQGITALVRETWLERKHPLIFYYGALLLPIFD